MPTRQLMTASAILQILIGLSLTFAPQEMLAYAGAAAEASITTPAQVAGAAFLGFGMLNWMSRAHILGGIYGRPLTMGNLLHYVTGFFALAGPTLDGRSRPSETALAIVYAAFALLFGRLLFTQPESAGSGR